MGERSRIRVSLVAVPEVAVSSLTGMYEVLASFGTLGTFLAAVPEETDFDVEIVAVDGTLDTAANGLALGIHRRTDEVERTDIVIVPALFVPQGAWECGRHPQLVRWLRAQHKRGALLCSACSGVLLLAETGLLDGREATIHWVYEETFRRNFPRVRLRIEEALIVSGARKEFILAGASASWHDLVLYLVSRMVGPTVALALAKFYLLQWHTEGQAPFFFFNPARDHGDAVVLKLQQWLERGYSTPSPVDEMVRLSGLPARSFKRRFTKATGFAPIQYVQRLRVEEAKQRLERSDTAVEDIGWAVGYADAAYFRRLFKRLTRMAPGAYRRKFRAPQVLVLRDEGE